MVRPLPCEGSVKSMVNGKKLYISENYRRSNVATARPLTLVRLAETLTQDRHNKNERQEMIRLKIKFLIDRHLVHSNHRIHWNSAE